MHLKVKKRILYIFTHVPGQDFIITPRQSEISHPPEGSIFWKIYSPHPPGESVRKLNTIYNRLLVFSDVKCNFYRHFNLRDVESCH